MDNKKEVHQGEVLMLLVKRSKMDGIEVAKMMNINPSYLSKLYNYGRLTIKVRRAAAITLGVDIDIFDTGLGYELPASRQERVGEPDEAYNNLIAENTRLREENAKIAEELLREKTLSDDLRKVLVQITKATDTPPEDTMQFVSNYGRGGKMQKSK